MMNKSIKLLLFSGILLIGTTAFSQVPNPTDSNNNQWDYCPSVPGIQGETFVCPGPTAPKPVKGNTSSGELRNDGVPKPSNSGNKGKGSGFKFRDILDSDGKPKWLSKLLGN